MDAGEGLRRIVRTLSVCAWLTLGLGLIIGLVSLINGRSSEAVFLIAAGLALFAILQGISWILAGFSGSDPSNDGVVRWADLRQFRRRKSVKQSAFSSSSRPDLVGVSGWLLLPFIGLFIAILRLVATLKETFPVSQEPVWSALTVPGGAAYHPLWKTTIFYEAVGTLLLLIWTVWLVVAFLRRFPSTPTQYIAWLWLAVAFTIGDAILVAQIPVAKTPFDAKTVGEILAVSITSAIWSAYMLRSRRVKNTFRPAERHREPDRRLSEPSL